MTASDSSNASTHAVEPTERATLDLSTFCVVLELRETTILDWIDEGVLRPRGETRRDWVFPPEELDRARRALRLQQDLGLNTAALPLVMDLLGEVHRLRRRVRQLEDRFFE